MFPQYKVLGSYLSDPVNLYPKILGPGTVLGGAGGVDWLRNYPYALPSIASACFLFLCAAAVLFGLEEVKILYYPSVLKFEPRSNTENEDSCSSWQSSRPWTLSVW